MTKEQFQHFASEWANNQDVSVRTQKSAQEVRKFDSRAADLLTQIGEGQDALVKHFQQKLDRKQN